MHSASMHGIRIIEKDYRMMKPDLIFDATLNVGMPIVLLCLSEEIILSAPKTHWFIE